MLWGLRFSGAGRRSGEVEGQWRGKARSIQKTSTSHLQKEAQFGLDTNIIGPIHEFLSFFFFFFFFLPFPLHHWVFLRIHIQLGATPSHRDIYIAHSL